MEIWRLKGLLDSRIRSIPRSSIPLWLPDLGYFMLRIFKGTQRSFSMPILPVPEAVRDMDRKMDQILEILRTHNSLLSQIAPQWTKLNSDLKALSNVESKLEEIKNSLVIIRDSVRLK
jgi:hypothetical protein